MPTAGYVKYLKWFVCHRERLNPLLKLPANLSSAPRRQDKWNLLKNAGDLVLSVVEVHPVREVAQVCATSELRQEVEQAGIKWDRLIDLLPALVDLVDIVQDKRLED
ncbi:hypothetical protein [Lacipirellula parvula]|nr:hypothetical protein [Lacipirellula parvula]